jgi:putative addiction module antidote
MIKAKVTQVGNSLGIVLPKETLSYMDVAKGDDVYFVAESPGVYRLSAYDPEFARQMEVAEQVMREDREVLRRLAK